jgi:hypothetical protein
MRESRPLIAFLLVRAIILLELERSYCMKTKTGSKLGRSRARHLSTSELRKVARKLTFSGTRAFLAEKQKAGRL